MLSSLVVWFRDRPFVPADPFTDTPVALSVCVYGTYPYQIFEKDRSVSLERFEVKGIIKARKHICDTNVRMCPRRAGLRRVRQSLSGPDAKRRHEWMKAQSV